MYTVREVLNGALKGTYVNEVLLDDAGSVIERALAEFLGVHVKIAAIGTEQTTNV